MARSKRQGGLGRGLGSLIPTDVTSLGPDGTSEGALRQIPVGDIVPNTYQPRRDFDEEALAALSASVGELGVLQPILVRPLDGGGFELVAGERRWRAAQRAGLERIPAIVRTIDDETSLSQAIVENVQRAELNPIEEAAAFQQLLDEFSLTQDDVARQVGRSRSAVANSMRLLQLPVDLQRAIIDGRLSAGHGRVLVPLPADQQAALASRVVDEGMSVRALEALARGDVPTTPPLDDADLEPSSTGSSTATPGRTKPPALLELEALLGDQLETKVSVTMGKGKGRIAIDFADIDDLERIYGLMTGQ